MKMVEIKPDSQAAREALFLDLYALLKKKSGQKVKLIGSMTPIGMSTGHVHLCCLCLYLCEQVSIKYTSAYLTYRI